MLRFFRRDYWDAERACEIEAHLAIESDENIARGMKPRDARDAAHRKLGNVTLVRENIYYMNTVTCSTPSGAISSTARGCCG